MPYYPRKYYNRSGYRRKRRYYKRKKGYGLMNRVRRLEKKTRQNRPQLLSTDTSGTGDIYTTPTIVKLGTIATDRITLKSFQCKFRLFFQTPQTDMQYYRIVIFTDRSNEGSALPGWGEIYKNSTGADAVMSLRYINTNENEGQRFRILYDKLVKIVDGETVDNYKFFNRFRKINIPSIPASSGTYWEKGGLYLGFVGTTATGITDLIYDIRIRYIPHST